MDPQALASHLTRLRRLGRDDDQVEVKASAGGLPKSLWESVSAFANTAGGLIILGLDESQGFTPATGFAPSRIMDALQSALSQADDASPKVTPIPDHTIREAEIDGAPVIVIEVQPLRDNPTLVPPCYITTQGIRRGSYKRVGDADIRLTDYEVYLLQTRNRPDLTDRTPVPDRTENDLSAEAVSGALSRLRRSGSHALDGLDAGDRTSALRRLNALTPEGAPTLAAYLALGTFPQQDFPHLTIDVAVHPTVRRSEDPAVRFTDRRVCDGPLPVAVRDAVDATLRHLSTRRIIQGVNGIDSPEIPEDVLREAITNAVMHRDYSPYARAQQVTVDVFPDRVEVTSPGGFWGDRTAETVLTNPTSAARNDALAALLRITPIPGAEGTVAEDRGSGIPRMISSLRRFGLPAPDYSGSTLDRVVVRLSRFGLITDRAQRWLSSLHVPRTLTRAEQVALVLSQRDDGVAVSDLRTNLGLDSDDARSVLTGLTRLGLLAGDGDGPFSATDAHTAAPAGPGAGTLTHDAATRLTRTEAATLMLLSRESPRTMREISTASGRSLAATRRTMRALIDRGLVSATASTQSRYRAYVLAAHPGPATTTAPSH